MNFGEGKRANARRFHKPEPSEAELETYGTDLLALDGWRSLKTDPVSDRSRGKGFGELGMADRLYIRYEEEPCPGEGCSGKYCGPRYLQRAGVMWIEWKRLGGKARLHQLTWIMGEKYRGALVLLAGEDFPATPEGFLEWYRGSGLMRREIR